MLRIFSVLVIALGMFALSGCQSTCNQAQPVQAAPMEMNETTCCKQASHCDKACHHECKRHHVTCSTKTAQFHRRARHQQNEANQLAAQQMTQQAGQQAAQQAAQPVAQQPTAVQ